MLEEGKSQDGRLSACLGAPAINKRKYLAHESPTNDTTTNMCPLASEGCRSEALFIMTEPGRFRASQSPRPLGDRPSSSP